MLGEDRYREFEKNQNKLLYPMYLVFLRYQAEMEKIQIAADEAMKAGEVRRNECLQKQQEFLARETEQEEEEEWSKEKRRLQAEHVEDPELTMKRFLANLERMLQENAKRTPLHGYDSPVRSESGYTIEGDLFLGEMELE